MKSIAPELTANANMVIRNHHTLIRIVSLNEIYVREAYAVTILNEKGYEASKLRLFYNKFIKIKSIAGRIYNGEGKEIRKLNAANVHDMPIDAGGAFVDDYRLKVFDFNYATYPFTVEFEIETKYNYSFYLPDWQPQDRYKCSLESADVNVEYPDDIALRYRTYHIDNKPEETKEGDKKIFSLAISNLPSVKEDELAPHENYIFPSLVLVSDKFELEDRQGSMESWASLGKFIYDLNANRDELPEEIKKAVHQLTDTCHNSAEKISLLYGYLQHNTRYVGIQLGIGGWQTFDANFVGTKGYGDCKALSNYMHSLLKEVGITSYQALVYAGEQGAVQMDLDFPHNQFDHAILCVPANKDTTWLECTSNTLPAGYLSDFTSDRNVLMLAPDGGHVVHTPIYTEKDNVISRNAVVHVDSNDVLKGDVVFNYKGFFYDREKHRLLDQPKDKIEYQLNSKFSLPNNKITNYYTDEGVVGCIPFFREQIVLSGTPNITRSGKRIFITPDIMMHTPEILQNETRTKSFAIDRSYQVNDTLSMSIDGKYNMESMPAEIKLSYSFGELAYKMNFENNEIKIVRHYRQVKGIYAPTAYADYVSFIKAANLSSGQKKVVLVKTE